MSHNLSKHITKAFLLLLLASGLAGCSWLKDDLDGCPGGCRIRVQVSVGVEAGGPANAEAFAREVNDLTLWVFDADGRFIDTFREQGDVLRRNNYMMELPLDPGRYQLVVWTGLDDSNYRVTDLVKNVSTLNDLTLRLERDEANRQNNCLTPLWYGRTTVVEVQKSQFTLLTVSLTKDTNTLVAVLQDTSGRNLDSDLYTYEIIAANGYMDADNRLLTDDKISYGAYFTQTAQVGEDTGESENTRAGLNTLSVARAELNTLRLMTDKKTRFVVTEKATGKKILNIDLTQYLLLTRELFQGSSGMRLTDQQYLDYEDRYSVIFFLTPTGDVENPYVCLTLNINGWIIRLNNAEL